VAEALDVAEQAIVGGMDGQDERDPFAEPGPFVRAPVNRRGDDVAGVVEDLARRRLLRRERRKRQREDGDQSKPVRTRSAI